MGRVLIESSELEKQKEGRKLLEHVCEAGNPDACIELGLHYRDMHYGTKSCELFESVATWKHAGKYIFGTTALFDEHR